jgi:tRNA A-37 threonylcarbamoyl transferase component Bud32
MGVVFRAYDTKTRIDVAIKAMRDISDPVAVELFTKEWSVLAGISHPNIVDVRDVGEFESNGRRTPFFVMPLLSGVTLARLIETSSPRLTSALIVEVMLQVCRGLQAAHERGLIHRDLKPSNIFILNDDSAKIIDFGIVHLAGGESVSGHKGTWQYMAPEATELQPATAASDIFALGVICYEAFTGRRPFARKTALETVEAIRKYTPPPASELNPAVTSLMSMVVHTAMAKHPAHRFSSAREFAETLRKAHLGLPVERFNRSRLLPRIARAKTAFAAADFDLALEIISELQAEGHIDPEIAILRSQIDEAVKQKKVRGLLDAARSRIEQDELPLAIEKLREVFDLDPQNPEAKAMRGTIERRRSECQIEKQLELARQYAKQGDFTQARAALREVLSAHSDDDRAAQLLKEVEEAEQQSIRTRAEKERLYDSAVRAYHKGEISVALEKMEKILAMTREAPDPSSRDAVYQSFCDQVRSEREELRSAYVEARRSLAEKNFAKTLAACDRLLAQHPGDPLFQALRLETIESERQELAGYIGSIHAQLADEPDLDRRVQILQEACARYPDEPQFQQSIKIERDRRNLIGSIAAKARQYEQSNQFAEALGQWEVLRNIYPRYPALEFEIERLMQRRQWQEKEDARLRLVDQIDRALETRAFIRAQELARTALADWPQDEEFASLERLARQDLERSREAWKLLAEAQRAGDAGRYEEQTALLRRAMESDDRNPAIRPTLAAALIAQARMAIDEDWHKAETLIDEAAALDSGQTALTTLRSMLVDAKRKANVAECEPGPQPQLQADQSSSTVLFSPSQFLRDFPRASGTLVIPRRAARHLQELAQFAGRMRAACVRHVASVKRSRLWTVIRSPRALKHFTHAGPIMAVAVALVAAARFYPSAGPRTSTPPPAAMTKVLIKRTPADAVLAIDGRVQNTPLVNLASSGAHTVVVSKTGFIPLHRLETPRAQWTFNLAAEPLHLRIFTAEQDGAVFLDGREAGKLNSGALPDLEVSPDGRAHKLNVRIPAGELFSATFTASPGARAAIDPIDTKDLIAVSSLGPDASVYAGAADRKLLFRSQTPQAIPAGGLQLHGIAPQDHQFTLVAPGNPAFSIEAGNAPVISFFLKSNPYFPYVIVSADQRDAHLSFDGVEIPRLPNGNWWVQRPPGTYALKVAAHGFYDFDQKITLAKGDGIGVRADLKPRPAPSVLSIANGTPSAEVIVDGQSIGAVDASGGFSTTQISPGQRSVELRKPGYESRQINVDLVAGQTASLRSRDSALIPYGSLQFSITPATAKVQYQQGEQSFEGRTSGSVSVPARRYHVAASADGFQPRSLDVTVQPGESTNVAMALSPIPSEPPVAKPAPPRPMESLFQDSRGVKAAAGGLLITSGATEWLTPGISDLSLAVNTPDNKSHLQFWIVAGNSTVVYEFASRRVSRSSMMGGKRQGVTLLKLAKDAPSLSLSFHIGKNHITLRGSAIDDIQSDSQDFTSYRLGVSGDAHFTIRTD